MSGTTPSGWPYITGTDHPKMYPPVTQTLANMLEALDTSGGGVTDHGALTGLGDDDHPQYLNAARGDARYDAAGAATAAVTAHTAAADPHPVYLTAAEGAAAYEPAGAVSGHAAKARLTANVTGTVPNATNQVVTGWTVTTSRGVTYSGGGNFTVAAAGVYAININGDFGAAKAAGQRMFIRLDMSTPAKVLARQSVEELEIYTTLTVLEPMAAGNVFYATVYQATGASQTGNFSINVVKVSEL